MKSLLLASALAVAVSASAQAARIGIDRYADTGNPFIYIIGDITEGDAGRFRAAAAKVANGVAVLLQSDGGMTFEAIEIGQLTRKRGFVTRVVKNERCVSACSLIWLAGATRLASPEAYIGFHASVDTRTGQDSSFGNAAVGSYMARLGYGDSAIFYATKTPHDKVEWLDVDAMTYGIGFQITKE